MNWKTSASSEHHQSRQLPRGKPIWSFTAIVNDMGAHRLSGQHHTVRPSKPSMTGAATPHSMLPVMRNGTSALPVRKRMSARASTSRAASRASMSANSISKLCLPFSASRSACGGSSPATAS